jgi:hypothetical protein
MSDDRRNDEKDDKKKDHSAKDLFDPERLRLSQNFGAEVGVKKALVTVPTRRPDRQWFFRVHPDPAYRLEAAILELKQERETYLVEPGLLSELPGEVSAKILCTAITRQQIVFLWPVRLPNPDGRHDEWSRSALQAAEMAKTRWIRLVANMNLGAYEIYEAAANLPDPEWPETDFKTLLQIGFRDHFIQDLGHPAIKKLRGMM